MPPLGHPHPNRVSDKGGRGVARLLRPCDTPQTRSPSAALFAGDLSEAAKVGGGRRRHSGGLSPAQRQPRRRAGRRRARSKKAPRGPAAHPIDPLSAGFVSPQAGGRAGRARGRQGGRPGGFLTTERAALSRAVATPAHLGLERREDADGPAGGLGDARQKGAHLRVRVRVCGSVRVSRWLRRRPPRRAPTCAGWQSALEGGAQLASVRRWVGGPK